MSFQPGTSNRTALRFVKEVTFKETPNNPVLKSLRYTGESVAYNRRNITSNEIRDDRMTADLITVGADVSGDLNYELSFASFDELIEGALCAEWGVPVGNVSSIKNGVNLLSFTIQKHFQDLAQPIFQNFLGCRIGGITLDFQTGQILTGTFSVMGCLAETGTTQIPGATITAPGLGNEPMNAVSNLSQIEKAGDQVVLVNVTNGGSGYTSAPLVAFTGGSGTGATAVAVIDGEVDSITITAAGSGYTTATATITGGGGSGALATVTLNSGAIDTITITDPGSGYTSAPTVTINGDGTGATATASIDAEVIGVTVTNGGNGYESAPTVSFTGGAGTGAAATAALAGPMAAKIRSMSMELTNNLRGQEAVGVLGYIGIALGRLEITGNIELYFENGDEYQSFLDNDEFKFSFVVQDSAGNSYKFIFPRVKYEEGTILSGGLDQDLMVNGRWRAIYDATSDCMIEIVRTAA